MISSSIPLASPATIEPTMKISALSWKISFRPNRSPSLPASAVATASASRYEVTTQAICPAPPRSATIVGSAVDTIV